MVIADYFNVTIRLAKPYIDAASPLFLPTVIKDCGFEDLSCVDPKILVERLKLRFGFTVLPIVEDEGPYKKIIRVQQKSKAGQEETAGFEEKEVEVYDLKELGFLYDQNRRTSIDHTLRTLPKGMIHIHI